MPQASEVSMVQVKMWCRMPKGAALVLRFNNEGGNHQFKSNGGCQTSSTFVVGAKHGLGCKYSPAPEGPWGILDGCLTICLRGFRSCITAGIT